MAPPPWSVILLVPEGLLISMAGQSTVYKSHYYYTGRVATLASSLRLPLP